MPVDCIPLTNMTPTTQTLHTWYMHVGHHLMESTCRAPNFRKQTKTWEADPDPETCHDWECARPYGSMLRIHRRI